ncbi:hypothetical protein [Alteraurantiacibacter aquimixticola]|uniref:Nuclear transport factor 2 family protein n=1 Tax=Alteraurantiacibacter aquimixticola TaxID=2489173 RepID=A0A4T3F3W8_9SPHN|nr:hypothetical protein [Alteraurantiacibacter aquimixticola]TIX51149.1 hypothetical protein E5222_01320 [Alteraurantiacibacter aquimixticola]
MAMPAPVAHAQDAAPEAAEPGSRPAQIDWNGVLILVRSSLLAVDQANKTGNYTVLRELGAPGFQGANTTARLADVFANLRSQNLDLSAIAVLEPQLALPPMIEPNGMLRLAGYFPSAPQQVNFDLLYEPLNGRWRLYGVAINVTPATPAAPQPLSR